MGQGTPGSANYTPGLLPQAAALTNINNNPYQQYQGQMVAGFNPLQTQAMGSIQSMAPSANNQQATGLAGMAGLNAQSIGQNQFTGANVNQYMNPYTQDVVQQQQNQAIQGYANQLPGLASAAANTGNLGGSREALMQSQAAQGLQGQLQGITANGYNNAFQNAQNQFNTSQQTGLQAAQGMNSSASNLAGIGQTNYGQQAGIASAQLGAGALGQNQQQQQLNTNYQNFINQQNYPYAQLGYLSDILHGTSTSTNNSGVYSNYQQAPNALGNAAGVGTGLAGLFGAMGSSGSTGGVA
jgi:hypothetical protein